ncbi:MAG: hypothetical protein IJU50_02100, partial [Lachnospiraceae bacterium]|nr:hypothetical protein [Lachnospiraceae bacterium]
LANLDLYGCGVNGIFAYDESGELYVFNSTIRDCSEGPLDISNCKDSFVFQDCALTGSGGGGFYDGEGEQQIGFFRCEFGEWESNVLAFAGNVYTEDCVFSEITAYPEYEDDPEDGEEYREYDAEEPQEYREDEE